MKFSNTLLKGGMLIAMLVMLVSAVSAQRTIRGKVSDADSGEGLIGATVTVVGTTRGAVTDLDGNFSVEVPAGSTQLRFAYTGYTEQTVEIGSSNVVNVAMQGGSLLDEVVVIGYGAVKKSDLTGSVVSVGEKDFNAGLVTAPDQLIQGRAAGVLVVNNSGQPGGGTTVRIRGNSSIRAGNEPLYVVDGIQLTGASAKPGSGGTELGNSPGSNPLNYLNPDDIESIQILKDASATAIYGSRGGNGVILITTKKGKAGVPSVQFNTSVGMSNILKKYDVLSADEYRSALNKYGLTAGDYGSSVDAMDEILQTGVTQRHNMSISSGNDRGAIRLGFGYLNQNGIIKENAFSRLNANIAGNYSFMDSKRLNIEFNLLTSNSNEDVPPVGTTSGFRGSVVANALQWNPTEAMYNADGTPVIIPKFGNFMNPVALIQAYDDQTKLTDVIASISPSFKITDRLTYKFNYNIAKSNGNRELSVASWLNMENVQDRGFAAVLNGRYSNQILTHTLNYITEIGSNISLNAIVGYEYQKRDESGNGISARDFITDNVNYVNILQNSSTGSRGVFSYANPTAELQSYFGRGIFNIRDKYLLTATVRADGSSKFGANNKYGVFPSVAFAWNLHQEEFLQGGKINALKFRLGWGQTGNSEFPAGASQDRYGFGQQSIFLENVANPDLKWETTTTTNAGIDFGFNNNKVYGSIDVFNRNTTDLLFQFPTIQPAPAGFYWVNLPGNVINTGLELALNSLLVDRDNFSWNIGGNISFLKNTLKNYDGPAIDYGQLFGQGSSGATSQRLADGQPLNSFYLREHIAVGADGQSTYENNEALAFVGDANPDILLGVNTGLTANKISFNMNFNGAFGHYIYNNTKMSVIPIGNLGSRNIDASLLEGANQEATSNAIKPSSRYLEKGDYVKLANATLGYNFGDLGKSVKNARVYITGSNLLVFTNYSGFDPEVNTVNEFNGLPSFGVEYIPYPSARTVMVGANFSF